MIGRAQNIRAGAGAILLALGFLLVTHVNCVWAQDEAGPQAAPTSFTPLTQGDVERAAEATTAAAIEARTPEASAVPQLSAAPTVEAMPLATGSPAATATTPGAPRKSSHLREKKSSEGAGSASAASPAPSPGNSPFMGLGGQGQKGPTKITSDSLALDYQNKAILFTGHVHAVQPDGDLTSDTLKVQYGADFHDIKTMYADGNVRISQGTRWVTGDHAILDQTRHTVKIFGNPVVHDGEDQVTGSLITVDLTTGKSNVDNARVIIFPRESKSTDNVDSSAHP
jgi:lipopolysaccharide transport protein LptA